MKDEKKPELGMERKNIEANSGGSVLGLPYPKSYDGSEDFVCYLKTFNRVATAHGWMPARCAQILPLYLTGSALAIYEGMPDREKNSWKVLVEGLASRLKKMSTKEMALEKLAERRQEFGESLEEFSNDLKKLVERAYPDASFELNISALKLEDDQKKNLKTEIENMAKRFREEICLEKFKYGLLPEIREKIIFMKVPSSLAEAVSQAKRVEELNLTIKADTWKRMEETEVNAALAEVNEVGEINADPDNDWGDEQIDPNFGPYYDEYYNDHDQYYDHEQNYIDEECQWLPNENNEYWGEEEYQDQFGNDFCCFDDQDDQHWPTDQTGFDEF